jgi:hypothetical protein
MVFLVFCLFVCFLIKEREPSIVVHTCNPSTQKGKAGGSQVCASLSNTGRLCLKQKQNNHYRVSDRGLEARLKQ